MNRQISSIISRYLIDRDGEYRGEVLRQFKELLRFDRVSRAEIDAHVAQQLAYMLNHAKSNSAFYRERIPDNITLNNSTENQGPIPILIKKDIQEHLQSILVPGIPSFEDATGGSSGQPTVFYTDLERKKAGEAATYWSNSLAGYEYGDRVAMLWGAARDNAKCKMQNDKVGRAEKHRTLNIKHRTSNEGEGRKAIDDRLKTEDGTGGEHRTSNWTGRLLSAVFGLKSVGARLRTRLRNWIENVRWYDAFDMGENRMRDFHRHMTRFAPHVLVGYAGSLYEYARFLEANNIKPGYPLKSIVSSAEVLTSASRKLISEVFQKPIYDRYGNREFGPIAAECEAHDGLHINERDMYVEVDSPNPYEIPGEIIVTYFRNKTMPFIRYNTGDVGVFAKGECACGRKTKRLKTIDGRTSDSIRTRDGKIIHGEYFTHMMYGIEGIRAFQFVQESLDSYVLRVECGEGGGRTSNTEHRTLNEPDWWGRVSGQMLDIVGENADVRLEIVDKIPLLPSGKRKFTVSMIK